MGVLRSGTFVEGDLVVQGHLRLGGTIYSSVRSITLPAVSITHALASGMAIDVNVTSTGTGIQIDNSNAGKGIYITNSFASTSAYGIHIANSNTGKGIVVDNSLTGTGIYVANSNTAYGIDVENTSTGKGIYINNQSTGFGIYIANSSTGNGIYLSGTTGVNLYNAGSSYFGTYVGINAVPSSSCRLYISNSTMISGIYINNTSTSNGLKIDNTNIGYGILISNTNGNAISVTHSASSYSGIVVATTSAASGIYISNNSTGYGLRIHRGSTGIELYNEGNSRFDGLVGIGCSVNVSHRLTVYSNAVDESGIGVTIGADSNYGITISSEGDVGLLVHAFVGVAAQISTSYASQTAFKVLRGSSWFHDPIYLTDFSGLRYSVEAYASVPAVLQTYHPGDRQLRLSLYASSDPVLKVPVKRHPPTLPFSWEATAFAGNAVASNFIQAVARSDGTVVCVYQNEADSDHLYGVFLYLDGTWSTPVELAEVAVMDHTLCLNILPNDTVYCVFANAGDDYHICYGIFSPNLTWNYYGEILATSFTLLYSFTQPDGYVVYMGKNADASNYLYEFSLEPSGQWVAASLVSSIVPGRISLTCVGTTVVCVYENTSDSSHMYCNTRLLQGVWGTAVEIYAGTISCVSLLPLSDGQIVLLGSKAADLLHPIERVRSAAGVWGSATEPFAIPCNGMCTAVGDDDTILVAHTSGTLTGFHHRLANGTWDPDGYVTDDSHYAASAYPNGLIRVAEDRFMYFFRDSAHSNYLYAWRCNSNRLKFVTGETNESNESQHALIELDDGRLMVVYKSSTDILASIRSKDNLDSESVPVTVCDDALYPSVVKLPDGTILCAYLLSATYYMYCKIFDPETNTWSAQVAIEASATCNFPSLGLLANGTVVCFYRDGTTGYLRVRYNTCPSSQSWSAYTVLLSSSSYWSSAGLRSDGTLLVAVCTGTAYQLYSLDSENNALNSIEAVCSGCVSQSRAVLFVDPDDSYFLAYVSSATAKLCLQLYPLGALDGVKRVIHLGTDTSVDYCGGLRLKNGHVLLVTHEATYGGTITDYEDLGLSSFEYVGAGITEFGYDSYGRYLKFANVMEARCGPVVDSIVLRDAAGGILGVTVNATSARAKKKKIVPFDRSGLKLCEDTQIVEFTFKDDPDEKRHIGFIADDTPWELATKNHDVMDMSSSIGVLIKAVQELSERNKALEEQLVSLRGDI